MKEFWYVASPYSHPDPRIVDYRYRLVEAYCAAVISRGEFVFSPIMHTHNMVQRFECPKTWAFWRKIDFAFVRSSKGIRVLTIDGWRESAGVTDEIAYAQEIGLPVEYVTLEPEIPALEKMAIVPLTERVECVA